MARRPNEAGKVRRSGLISTFGPGAIVDLRSSRGAPLSGVVSGLEEWDETAPQNQKGLLHPQRIREPRLEKALHVHGFRTPPVPPDDTSQIDVIRVVRFPTWLQCPKCNRLGRWRDWKAAYPGEPERLCAECEEKHGAPIHVVPVRFITACKGGHLEEFPWQWWIGCKCKRPRLELSMEGAGLSGKILQCKQDGCASKPRSLEGILKRHALEGLKCHGNHPWYPGPPDAACPNKPRAMQRGAANVYWGRLVSTISIPPYSRDPREYFGEFWSTFEALPEEQWGMILDSLLGTGKLKGTRASLLKVLTDWKAGLPDIDTDLEWPEFQQFVRGCNEPVREGEFEVTPEAIPEELQSVVGGLGVAHRLREVQALVSFTRLNPPTGPFRDATQKDARLSARAMPWLPASELRGEGIFLSLVEEEVRAWEERDTVQQRFRQRLAAVMRDLNEEEAIPDVLSPRFMMLHALSHALIRELSLSCGYSSSSLRERIYSSVHGQAMAGLLILTAAADSDGTLGGLARQGRRDLFAETFLAALQASIWCASDPVCITGTATFSSPRNAAACHSCMLLPETSCSHFNLYLDRALLVGTPEDPSLGFFAPLIQDLGAR